MARRVVAAVMGLFLWSGLAFGEPLKIGVLTDMSGVIADTVTFTGTLPTIAGSSSYAPVPPAAKLTG